MVAMISRMDGLFNNGDLDSNTFGIMAKANQLHRGLFERMLPSPIEARRMNRQLGLKPPPGMTQQQMCMVKVTPEMRHAVEIFSTKLAKSLYYRHTAHQRIFPVDGTLALNWFTNSNLIENNGATVFDFAKHIQGQTPTLKNAGQIINDQFEYKFSMTSNEDLFLIQVNVRQVFGLLILGSTEPNKLDDLLRKHRPPEASNDPIVILQSPQRIRTA